MQLAESSAVGSSLDRIREYLYSCVRIDTRALAAFRVLVGVLIVADLLLRYRNFEFFYTDEGVVPQALATQLTPEYAISVYYLTTDPNLILALFVLQGLIAVQLIVGFKTRIAMVLSFVFVVSLDHHNPMVTSYADTLFRLLLFWAIFLPLGERWSIDAVHRNRSPRESFLGVASAAILVQMVVMYTVNGYHKLQSDLWRSGDATPLIFGLDNTTFLLGDILRFSPTMLEFMGFVWFAMMLLSPLLIVLRGRPRMALVGMFVAAHLSFGLTVRIGAFPYVAIAGLVPFLQAQFWDDVTALGTSAGFDGSRVTDLRSTAERLAMRVPDVEVAPKLQEQINQPVYDFVIGVIVITIALVIALSLLQVGGVVADDADHGEEIETVAMSLGIDQPEWSIFAPNPRTFDWYFVFPAETANGDRIDAYNDRQELTYDRPHDELQKQFGTYRERFYMTRISNAGSYGNAQELLAEYHCERWEQRHGEELTHLNMYRVIEDVTVETIDDPEHRDRRTTRIYRHGCGDNDPKEIEPPEF